MSSPEADNPPPLEDTGAAFRQENEKQRKSVIEKIDGINFRKTRLKPSITPRERATMPLVDLVKAEHGLTHPEDIVLERMRDINQLARGLQNAHIDPEDSEETDPLYQKIETALNPEDTRSVKNFLFYNISERLLFRAWRRPPHDVPEEEIEWENKWDEYFKKNPAVIEQSRAQAIKENNRFYLSRGIKGVANGDPVEEEMLAFLLLDCNPTPADLKTDPLFQRLFEVCDRQGKDPEQILTHINIEVKKRLEWEPHSPWLQEWSKALSATSETPESQPPAEEGGHQPATAVTQQTIESRDSETDERGAVTESDRKRNEAIELLGEILEMKTGLASDPSNPESIKNVTIEEVLMSDSKTDALPELIYLKRDDMLSNLSQVLIEAKIGPDATDDELYGFLDGVLSEGDYKSVVQKIRYKNIAVMQYLKNEEYYKQWSDFFNTNPDITEQVYRQGHQDRAGNNLARHIYDLANDPQTYSAYRLSYDLFEMNLTPEDFNSNQLIQRLTTLFQQNSINPKDMLTNFFSQIDQTLNGQTALIYDDDMQWLKKWEHNLEFQAWKRQRQTRQSPVTPNTSPLPARSAVNSQPTPESRTQKFLNGFARIIQSGADHLEPIFKSSLEKVKKHGLREGLSSTSDYFLGVLLGAGIRWGITSAGDPGRIISASVGALEGGYKAFRRANTKYEEKLRLRAASGDLNAQNELDTFNKDISKEENIIRKELVTKRRIAMKRFKSLPNKEKISLIGYTSLGSIMGAIGGVIGHNGVDMLMENSPALIESTIQFAKEAIDAFVDQNFVLHGTVRDK